MLLTVTLSQWSEIKDLLKDAEIIGVDTETNHSGIKGDYSRDIRDGRGWCIGISFSVRVGDVYFTTYVPLRHRSALGFNYGVGENVGMDVLEDIREFLETYTGYIVCHNAKFDLVSLSTVGIAYTGKFYDTLLICHLINENLPYDKNLTNCVKKYVDGEESKRDDRAFKAKIATFGWEGIPVDDMRIYAAHDACLCLALLYGVWDQFKAEVPDAWWEHKQKFTRVIIAMEKRGVRIDVDLCNRMAAIGDTIMTSLVDTVGGNLGSSVFLKEVLIDRLGLPVVKTSPKTGKPSFDKDAMEQYDEMLVRSTDPTAQYVLEYRGWQKSVSSNYVPYVQLLSPDGRLRPNYKLHGTKTGRSSCEKPNLQQIPRKGENQWNGQMKKCFIPADDFDLWEADYAQLELRLGTGYAKEKALLKVFEEDRDIFTEMSPNVGLPRQDTKTFVYLTQYGGGVRRAMYSLGISEQHAKRIRDNYQKAYPQFVAVSRRASAICKTKRKVKLWSGRYRHFQYPKDEGHKAFNSLIQGGAADIVETRMVELYEKVDCEDCRMLLTVHDSVLFEIRKGKEDYYRGRITEIMSDVRPKFGVKFAVDFHKWGE